MQRRAHQIQVHSVNSACGRCTIIVLEPTNTERQGASGVGACGVGSVFMNTLAVCTNTLERVGSPSTEPATPLGVKAFTQCLASAVLASAVLAEGNDPLSHDIEQHRRG